jgi:translation elongation factor P/translation initiation factor 5A
MPLVATILGCDKNQTYNTGSKYIIMDNESINYFSVPNDNFNSKIAISLCRTD